MGTLRRLVLVIAGLAALCALGPGSASAQPVSCGQVITQSTTLEQDLSCPSPPPGVPAIDIGAANITLDLAGHTVSSGHMAIRDLGHDGVTIKNGTVVADDGDVVLVGVRRARITDVVARGLTDGFVLTNSDGNTIESSTLPGVGIRLSEGSDLNTIRDTTLTSSEGFIWLSNSNRNLIVDSYVEGTDGPPIWLNHSDHNRLVRNQTYDGFRDGVTLTDSNYNELVGNIASGVNAGPPGRGVELHRSSHNVLRRNLLPRTSSGAWIESGAGNVLQNNWATEALGGPFPVTDGIGFRVDAGATQTWLAGNVATQFSDDGFHISAPGTVLRRNTANINGDLGIEAVSGVIDLGGNRASGNGNPLQCVNVVCR
jgi:parallel beta-helix repeat protein